jgi:hypothetical protein
VGFDALNTAATLVYQYPELTVYIGDASGNPPTSSPTVFADAFATLVVQSAGGSRLDFASLAFGLQSHLQNRTQPAQFARMVDVLIPATPDKIKLHRGDYVAETVRIDQQAESLTAQVQLRPYHFGLPVTGYTVWNEPAGEEQRIEDDIVFNPFIDQRVLFNKSSKLRSGTGSATVNLWIHPEAADDAVGADYHLQTRQEWTLAQAVLAMCWELNTAETFILNFDQTTLETKLSSALPVRELRIPLGTQLHQALDTLLIPAGFNWYVDYKLDEEKPQLKAFKIGDGTQKELKFQAVGSVLDLDDSNLNQFEVSNAIGDSFNRVIVMGDFERAEVTLDLYPAWPAAKDSLAADDLRKDGSEYTGNETVWRLWIANEAGDLDPEISRLGQLPTVPDLAQVFSKYWPHRRTIEDPLTYWSGTTGSEDTQRKQRFPIQLEYSIDGGYSWQPEDPEWTVRLCPDQIGVLFDGMEIPTILYEAGDQARLRITGTVAGDARLTADATKQAGAVNGREFRQVIPVPDKFAKRWRQEYGPYASVLADTGNAADERDDAADALTYAERIRDQNHFADVSCEFRLPGWHTNYEIGDLLTKIAGREISLNAAPTGYTRYVQIVERRWEMGSGGPSTVLIVDRGLAES